MFRLKDTMDFSNTTAIVTGAGRGIGRAIALALCGAGATVFAISKSNSTLEKLKADCAAIRTLQCDLGNVDDTRRVFENIPAVDFLVNNAAVIHSGTVTKHDLEHVDHMYNVNLRGLLHVTQLVANKMKEYGKNGVIVNISSLAGLRPYNPHAGYSMLKAALDSLTKMMVQDLGPCGIRVNSVNPGPVQTDMLDEWTSEVAQETGVNPKDGFPVVIPVQQVVNLVLFLLSDAAPMIQGAIIPIDGGMNCMCN